MLAEDVGAKIPERMFYETGPAAFAGESGRVSRFLRWQDHMFHGKCGEIRKPAHIVSAQIAKLGLTLGQEAAEGKSNEIPPVQRPIKMLRLKGRMVGADALNCQKDTAKAIVGQGADCLLSAKDNQPRLKRDIEDCVQYEQLRKSMKSITVCEKNRGRVEKRARDCNG
ncbi:MAG: ISAs1 family transposase [Acidaminococcales bacterium]|nr:ISAs1 family transposase [Acidaminococcales bacterium]